MKTRTQLIYSIIIGVFLTFFSAFLVMSTQDPFPSEPTQYFLGKPIVVDGGCFGEIYTTGFPFAYNKIGFGSCVETIPNIEGPYLVLDLLIYTVITYFALILAHRHSPNFAKKIVIGISVLGAIIVTILISIYLLLLKNRGII